MLKAWTQFQNRNKQTQFFDDFVRPKLFAEFFSHYRSIKVCSADDHLNRECSLFMENSQILLVGSFRRILDAPIEVGDITLHTVNFEDGETIDHAIFKNDKIFLLQNLGLSLYEDLLAVLSYKFQVIHLFKVTHGGRFVRLHEVGMHYVNADSNVTFLQSAIPPISVILHQVLVHIFKLSREKNRLASFFVNFDYLSGLQMQRFQLLDRDTLFIKFGNSETITSRDYLPKLFVVYSIHNSRVLTIYENSSTELLKIFEDHSDDFCFQNGCLLSLKSNSSMCNYERIKQMILSSRRGTEKEAAKRILSLLPITCQSFMSSPYLDVTSFKYDDKLVSILDRPKVCGDLPIRFFCKRTGRLVFKMNVASSTSTRSLINYFFHPIEPFIMSLHRTDFNLTFSVHLRYPFN